MLEVRLNAPNLKLLRINYCEVERIVTIRGCPRLKTLYLSNYSIMKVITEYGRLRDSKWSLNYNN